MGRSTKKGPYIKRSLLEKVEAALDEEAEGPIRTWSRDSMILPRMIGLTVEVHNGKRFFPVYISEEMVGHRLGEFAPTRTFRSHGRAARKAERKPEAGRRGPDAGPTGEDEEGEADAEEGAEDTAAEEGAE